MWGLCVSCLGNSESVGVLSSSLQEMYSGGCFSSICVGGCVFPAFVIQNLWVCSVASLQEMYSGGCFSSICGGGFLLCVSSFVIQNLWVCSVASLQEIYSVYLLQQYMCVWLGVSCLCNSESVGGAQQPR